MKKNVNLFPISEAPAPRPGGKRQSAPGTEEEHSVNVQQHSAFNGQDTPISGDMQEGEWGCSASAKARAANPAPRPWPPADA